MKSRITQFIIATLLMFCALPVHALIVLGGDAGHTNAPTDDPGWDNIGYVRSQWNPNRASGVYIGDGWVLCSYHEIYYDAPTGIVFNAEPGTAYPVDVSSYVRLDTNSFMRLADSPDWIPPQQVYLDYSTDYERGTNWNSLASQFAPTGADIAMFRLLENPDIEPVQITKIQTSLLSAYLNQIKNEVTAIATGRPRLEERTYWTTNWVETTSNSTEMAYSGYYDWPDEPDNPQWYQPICRWGKNLLYYVPTTVTRPPFGSTICLPTVFNDYGSGGDSNTFQMARLDSGGGVFYKGSGQWELLGMLTAKRLPNDAEYTTDRTIHPFGSVSMVCDLSQYREQIMEVTRWPDLSLQMTTTNEAWIGNGQQADILIITSNNSPYAIPHAFTNTVEITQNDQIIQTVDFYVPALISGASFTNLYPFGMGSAGTWKITATADSRNTIYESIEGTASMLGYPQNNAANTTFYTGPDLSITNLTPYVTNAPAGTPIAFEIGSKNGGNADASDAFNISLYLSSNDTISTMSEAELAGIKTNSITVTGLTRGASHADHFTVTAPSKTGTYYIRARIDSSNTVTEALEDNNWSPRSEIRVGPDLSITGLSPFITNAVSGSQVPFKITAENQGDADISGSFEISLYTNTTDSFTTMSEAELAEILASSITVNGLSGYATSTNILSIITPATPGIYYVKARIDGSNTVYESVESNNWGPRSEIRVGPDLVIAETSPGTTNAAPGGPVSIDITVKNLGVADVVQEFVLGVYAVDLQTSQGTSEAIWTNTIASLPAKTSTTVTAVFDAPSDVGSYFLVSNADDYNSSSGEQGAVNEYREDNNQSNPYIQNSYCLLRVGPDLVVSFTETNALRAMAGSAVKVYADISNDGSSSGIAIESVLQLSTNSEFTTFSEVATNTVIGSAFRFRAPRDPGTYYLRAETDPLNLISEFNEENNFSDILLLNVTPLAMPWLNLLLD